MERNRFDVGKRAMGTKTLHLTASFGVEQFLGAHDSGLELFSRADQALYEAKTNGRNRVVSLKEKNVLKT